MTSNRHRYYEIDFLRGIACLMVVAFHYLYRGQLPGWISSHPPVEVAEVAQYGFLGVNLFFLISGFVIFMTAERADVRDFVASRISRLFPAFWASVLLTASVAWMFDSEFFGATIVQAIVNLSMIPNWFGVEFVDGAYWSLSVELNFYIAIGLIIFFKQIRNIERILAIWLLVSLVYVVRPSYTLDILLNARYGEYFCAGISAHLIRSRGFSVSRGALFAAAYVLAISQYILPALSGHQSTPAGYLWITSVGTTAIFALFVLIAFDKFEMHQSAITKWAGRLTYPVYLLHQNVGYILLAALAHFVPSFSTRLVMVAMVVGFLAWLVNRYVEASLGRRLHRALKPTLDSVTIPA